MKSERRKKNGSSLMVILIIFAILTITGMAVLPLMVSGLKLRNAEGEAKNRFYASESGLEQAYGVLGEIIDVAIKEAKDKSISCLTDLKLEERKLKVVVDKVPDPDNYINIDGTLNKENIKVYQDYVFKQTYKEYFSKTTQYAEITAKLRDGTKGIMRNGVAQGKPELTINTSNFNFITEMVNGVSREVLKIDVTSSFTKDLAQKKVATTFEVMVPSQEANYYGGSTVVKFPTNLVWQKAIAAEGNMEVNGGTVKITGDINIKGTGATMLDGSVDEKAGVMVNKGNLVVKGLLATRKNVATTAASTSIKVQGNIYANNLTVFADADDSNIEVNPLGTIPSGEDPIPTITSGGAVFTKNDLTINANNASVNIAGPYLGISDGSDSVNNQPDASSSIKINGDGTSSKLSIGENSIIMGVAYVDTKNIDGTANKYKTSESISIKGNYRAYTYPLNISPDESDINKIMLDSQTVNFQMYDPLSLITNFKEVDDIEAASLSNKYTKYKGETNYKDFSNKALDVNNKSDYFKAYYDQYKGTDGLKFGNITLPTHLDHTGTVFYKDKDGSEQINGGRLEAWSPDASDRLIAKIKEFKRMVYLMGDFSTLDSNIDSKDVTVSSQIDFANIPKRELNISSTNTPFVVLNGNGTGQNYAIVGAGGSAPVGYTSILSQNGILITKGDVMLCGAVDFKGTILAGGDIICNYDGDNVTKKIQHNAVLVKQLIAENYSEFSLIFKNDIPTTENSIETNTTFGANSETGTEVRRTSAILKATNWKLLQ